jgi:hypothetical protein
MRRSSLSNASPTVLAALLISVTLWTGRGRESSPTTPSDPSEQSSTFQAPAPAPAIEGVNLQPSAEADVPRPAETIDPANDLDYTRPVTECGVIGAGLGFTQISAPWADLAR